ncbi:MAG: secondary thiamine-phosphate synthase enzyme YjbQ [Vicinamibacterales bacterium]
MSVADTLPVTVVHRAVVTVQTGQAVQIVDLTPAVDAVVRRAGLGDGLVAVTTRHTTTGLVLNDAEPLLQLDVVALLDRLVPRGLADAHDDLARRHGVAADERVNGHAHSHPNVRSPHVGDPDFRAVLLRASETLPVAAGRLALGRWQRLLFVELDGAQPRQVSVTCLGTAADAGPSGWPVAG